mmetsp:Transcript_27682/g.44357  ORF Transcript_27682/g.44357 Transcript_27682/m.44357 type:complete len:329 (+) Transcript_27682:202-1188(+)
MLTFTACAAGAVSAAAVHSTTHNLTSHRRAAHILAPRSRTTAPPSARRAAGRGLRVSAGGVDPESLAILQQRLGQRIQLEGAGAERLNATAGQLLGSDGRAIDKDARKKVLKADEAQSEALEINFDPEGLFKDVDESAASMLIDKKLREKELSMEKKEEEALKAEYEKARAELEAARDAREQPTTHAALIAYFFDTEFNEMEYEIVKQRPLLTEDFFAFLKKTEDEESSEAEKGKLEALFTVTSDFVGFVDQTTRAMLSPLVRLKKLLESKDKRAMILEMVDKDELDLNLMALLKTNINTARQQGGQEDAVKFMEKIYAACAKFVDGA